MSENRYYWIKTKRDVFNGQDESAAYLLTLEHGAEYFCIFQNIAVIAADKDGALAFSVKGELKPYSDDYIADRCFLFDKERVKEALKVLVEIGYIERGKDGILRVQNIDDIVGNETAAAVKKREYRSRGKEDNVADGEETMSETMSEQNEGQNEDNVRDNVRDNVADSEETMSDKSSEYRVQSTEYRVQSTESNKDNVIRTPLTPQGEGAGEGEPPPESEKEQEEPVPQDYPDYTAKYSEEDHKHYRAFKDFCFDWDIDAHDVADYSIWQLCQIDWDKMYEEVLRSPSFLQKRTALGITFFIKHSEAILSGKYREDREEGVLARQRYKLLRAQHHINAKNKARG